MVVKRPKVDSIKLMTYNVATLNFWRNRLPHWEVKNGRYFITIRCYGSLPGEVRQRLHSVQNALAAIKPSSTQFVQLQRQYFLTLEKYLDKGKGFSPFWSSVAAQELNEAIDNLPDYGWKAPHFVIMPNHVHLLTYPFEEENSLGLKLTWQRFKGRTARTLNEILGRSGAFWQADWFDRWMRSESEEEKVIEYIHDNAVKAGLVKSWKHYRWVR